MKKFAVFSNDDSRWGGKNFKGFLEAETTEEAEKEISKNWFSCNCDCVDECLCEDDEEECNCNMECECSFWPQEVSMDVIDWDIYEEKFYTQLGILEKKVSLSENQLKILEKRKQSLFVDMAKLERALIKNAVETEKEKIEMDAARIALQAYKESL